MPLKANSRGRKAVQGPSDSDRRIASVDSISSEDSNPKTGVSSELGGEATPDEGDMDAQAFINEVSRLYPYAAIEY